MRAIEFHATAYDGIIKLPTQFRDWEGRSLRVILLEEEQPIQEVTGQFLTEDAIAELLRNPLQALGVCLTYPAETR
jgi:hypothetical protein